MHGPTDEASLKLLATQHPQHAPLLAAVLEHRCLTNCLSKWLDAPWVRQVHANAGSAEGARVHCSW